MTVDQVPPVEPPIETGDNYKNAYLSPTGFIFIKAEEGFAAEPYDLGDGTLTTGYGTTSAFRPEEFQSLIPRCTEEEAAKVLGNYTRPSYTLPLFNALISDGVTVEKMNQAEFDAFGSLTYNSGLGNVMETDIYSMYINGASKQAIAERWKTTLITNIHGEEQAGLLLRREKESKMFLGEPFEMKRISNVTDGGYVEENDGKGYIPPEYQ